MNGIILIVIGLVIIIFSFPKIRGPIMTRFMNEGVIIPKIVKPENAEIIRHAGPSISIFAIGFILIFIGLLLTLLHS